MIKLQTRRTRHVWQWSATSGTGQNIQDGAAKLNFTSHGTIDINHDNLVLQSGTDIILNKGTYWISGLIVQDYDAGVVPNHMVLALQLWRGSIIVAWYADHQLAPYNGQEHAQIISPTSIDAEDGTTISIVHEKLRPPGGVGAFQQVRFGSPSFLKVIRVTP